LAKLPNLEQLTIGWEDGLDLSPLAAAPKLTQLVLYKVTGDPPPPFSEDVEIVCSDQDDPEYSSEELCDENGDFNLDFHTCETCGKVIEEPIYPDSQVTGHADHNFHCGACDEVFFGACSGCSAWKARGYLQYEIYADEPMMFELAGGPQRMSLSQDDCGFYEELCSDCQG
jgi:hypothetical protein